ncbi:MAG: hypothetical protein HUK00_00380 [Bacteroidaceae bacterium]|nr:hypothetical protein [Bacteroidaceae bacterium]
MKKQLLTLAVAALAITAANAQTVTEPMIGSDILLSNVSPNGKYAAGTNLLGCVDVADLTTGQVNRYYDESGEVEYTLGVGGNAVSDNGIVLISTTYEGTPAYIEGGVIKVLPVPAGTQSAICNAITPDGSRIAGTIGVPMSTTASVVMQRPVIWDRNEDGTYGMPVELPYPTMDFTGRLPQYVLTDCISADGKTIGCQVVDYSGYLSAQPMVLKEDADGKWSYTLYGNEFINPNAVEFPEYPGESPDPVSFMSDEEAAAYAQALVDAESAVEPSPMDYMGEESKAAYQQALEEEPWAWYSDYMTEEELDAYSAALDEYYKKAYPNPTDYLSAEHYEAFVAAYTEWEEKLNDFDEVVYGMMGEMTNFTMNSCILSQNGRYYALAGAVTDMDTWEEKISSYVFDLQSSSPCKVMTVEGENTITPSFIASDGRVLAAKPATYWDPFATAYFAADSNSPLQPLQDIVKEKDATLYAWMEQNMVHQITETYWDEDLEEDVEVTKDVWVIGMPSCDNEMKTFTSWAANSWDYDSDAYSFTYVYSLGDALQPEASKVEPTIQAAGAGTQTLYDVCGMRIDKPTKGGVVIVRNGDKVSKMVVK